MENNLKFNSAICTSREQSERLLALGIKPETADMSLCYMTHDIYGKEMEPRFLGCIADPMQCEEMQTILFSRQKFYPAWSLHRLIEMMPLDVIPEGGFDNCFTLIKNYPKGYSVEYDGFSYYHKENIYDTLIDGIEHLIKEGYFPKEYFV